MNVRKFAPASAAVFGLFAGNAVLAADLVTYDPVVAATVSEPGDWYISLFAGGVWTQDVDTRYNGGSDYSVSFDPGYSLGIAVGGEVFDNVRGEIEVSAGRAAAFEYDDGAASPAYGNLSTAYLLGNLWYDFDTGSSFTPYIGGGLGLGYATGDITFDGNDYGYGTGEFGFAYQLGAGVTVDMAENVALDLGYRFKGIADIDFTDSDGGGTYAGGNVYSHTVQAGLRLSF